MPNVKVQERIHHGQYRHKRVIELYALTELTVKGILESSAYPVFEPTAKEVRAMLDNLKGQGAHQLGWADFEVIDPTEPDCQAEPILWTLWFNVQRDEFGYRTTAQHYATSATEAIARLKASTESDSSYSWDQCRVVAVLPTNAATADVRRYVWEAAE